MIVVLTDTAKNDLENIYQYYHIINPTFAAKIYNNILEDIEILETFPYLASSELLLTDPIRDYRSFIVAKGKIKIVYYVDEDIVYIIFIWDCRQNPENLSKKIL